MRPARISGPVGSQLVVLSVVSVNQGQPQPQQRKRRIPSTSPVTPTRQPTPPSQQQLELAVLIPLKPSATSNYLIPYGCEAAAEVVLQQAGSDNPGAGHQSQDLQQKQHGSARRRSKRGMRQQQLLSHSDHHTTAGAGGMGSVKVEMPLNTAVQNIASEHTHPQQVAATDQLLQRPATASPRAPVTPLPAADVDQATATAAAKPAWALAVDRGVAALSNTQSARRMRWGHTQRSGRSTSAGPHHAAATHAYEPGGSQLSGHRGHTSAQLSSSLGSARQGMRPELMNSIDEFLEEGRLSLEGEQQLCQAYQRLLALQQLVDHPEALLQLLQQAAHGGQELQVLTSPPLPPAVMNSPAAVQSLLHDPAAVQREGLLAQELLVQLYEPLLINRAKRAQTPRTDLRELLAAARRGLLRAAARFDAARTQGGRGRLYALADSYIKMALRDVSYEYQPAVVNVPLHVTQLAAKLRWTEQQLQQQRPGYAPTLQDVADAAGVSLKHAQQALDATGSALQGVSLLHGVDQDKHDRGSTGSGLDLQQVDVSLAADSEALAGVVGAGGLTAARSGLQEEVEAAAERSMVDDLLRGLMSRLSPEDQHLLRIKLEGGSISGIARELGVSRQWGSVMVDQVVSQLRESLHRQACGDAELAALLSA